MEYQRNYHQISSMAGRQRVYFRGPRGKIRKHTKNDVGSQVPVYFSLAVIERISVSHCMTVMKVLLYPNTVIELPGVQVGVL